MGLEVYEQCQRLAHTPAPALSRPPAKYSIVTLSEPNMMRYIVLTVAALAALANALPIAEPNVLYLPTYLSSCAGDMILTVKGAARRHPTRRHHRTRQALYRHYVGQARPRGWQAWFHD